ncbi:MAG: hypothetical protein Q4A84_04465 [Neisseria sp.]|nr:hypothetical protein [Neisseria sp.]MDO4640942.1 hypothetical protein [Neisseria sp.]
MLPNPKRDSEYALRNNRSISHIQQQHKYNQMILFMIYQKSL